MHELPKLTYTYEDLSKSMSSETMMFHHSKHHQTYVDKLNATIEANPELKNKPLEELFINLNNYTDTLQMAIRNFGGGHYNHSLFWQCMSPNGGGVPSGNLAELIISKYGDFDNFITQFTMKSLSVFGSGWTWLQPNGDIVISSNQDNPLTMGLEAPLLCLDVWEHAYYIDYRNKRDEFVKSWWSVVDWDSISKRYEDYLLNK